MSSSAILRLVAVGLCLALGLSAAPKPTVGFVTSDFPFLIEQTEVRGNGSLLAGEGVSTNYLPARLHLNDGAEYVLGIGSHTRVYEDRIDLEGVSLEIVRPGESLRMIQAAGLEVVLLDPKTAATLYTDRADELSVRVAEGALEVRGADGSVIRSLRAGDAATFADTHSQVSVGTDRAGSEIGRIQMRQIDHMKGLEQGVPTARSKRTALAAMLGGAGGGAALAAGLGGGGMGSGPSSFTSGLGGTSSSGGMLATSSAVNEQLNQTDATQVGCANANCQTTVKLVSTNIYYGYIMGLPFAYPGCSLCSPYYF